MKSVQELLETPHQESNKGILNALVCSIHDSLRPDNGIYLYLDRVIMNRNGKDVRRSYDIIHEDHLHDKDSALLITHSFTNKDEYNEKIIEKIAYDNEPTNPKIVQKPGDWARYGEAVIIAQRKDIQKEALSVKEYFAHDTRFPQYLAKVEREYKQKQPILDNPEYTDYLVKELVMMYHNHKERVIVSNELMNKDKRGLGAFL